PVYALLAGLVGLALLGWARRLTDWRKSSLAVAGIYFMAAVWFVGVLLALLNWMQRVHAPHGRLLFPALGAWGLLLAAGWTRLAPGQTRLRRCLPFVPLAALLLLSLAAPWAIIRPAFAPPRLMSPQEAVKNITPQELLYGDQARLLGYRVEPESAAAGERVRISLCWEAVRRLEQDYTLFIHLLGRDNARVAERTTYSGQGRFPSRLWPPGRAFCESYWLEIASWAAAPELYALEVGLYDAETGQRLAAQNASGQAVEPPTVGLVRVTPAEPAPPAEHALSYDLDAQIALVGYDSSTDLSADNTLTLTLYWQALRSPQGDYKVFVHLLDEKGEQVT
ncbi:MAG: hypothetical protein GY824_07215, partial [Delftia sp.]|nr:hypothetical protein [Delftia sp.]